MRQGEKKEAEKLLQSGHLVSDSQVRRCTALYQCVVESTRLAAPSIEAQRFAKKDFYLEPEDALNNAINGGEVTCITISDTARTL